MKRVPTTIRECYQEDDVVRALHAWSKFLKGCAVFVVVASLLVGCLFSVVAAIVAVEEVSGDGALTAFFVAFGGTYIFWIIGAVVEYFALMTAALLLDALASIVFHTKINADLNLYKTAKEEGYHEPPPAIKQPLTKPTAPQPPLPSTPQTDTVVSQAPVPVVSGKEELNLFNVWDFLQAEVRYDNVRGGTDEKGRECRYADVTTIFKAKGDWTFENAVVNFSVRYGHGYKSLDKESQTYIYPVSNDCVCLSVSGEGMSKTETVCCMLKAGAPALSDEAKVEAIVATGTVLEQSSQTHRWRCACGNMINQNPCPHCGRTI